VTPLPNERTYYVVAGTAAVLVHNCGDGVPGHTVEVTSHGPDGEVLNNYGVRSGRPTPEEASLGGGWNTQAATHTENRVGRMSGASSGSVDIPNDPAAGLMRAAPGDLIVIEGQLPPCPRCQGAMNRIANEVGASVAYIWNGAKGAGTWFRSGK
jgi:hypothetical protein